MGSQTLGQGKDTGLGSYHTLLHQKKTRGLIRGKLFCPLRKAASAGNSVIPTASEKEKKKNSAEPRANTAQKRLKIKLHLNQMD